MKVYIENKNYYFNDNFPNIPIGEFIIYMANADFAKNEHNQYRNPKIEKILSEFNENPQNYDNYSLICNEIIINGFTNFSLIESIVEKSNAIKWEISDINNKLTLVYDIENFQQLLLFDFLKACELNSISSRIKICENCGKLFYATTRLDTKYCRDIAPQNPKYTCSEYRNKGAYYNDKQTETTKLSQKILKRLKTRAVRKPDNEAVVNEYQEFMSAMQKWREDVKNGVKTDNNFLEWLKVKDVEYR